MTVHMHYKWHPIAYTHVRVALNARAHKRWHTRAHTYVRVDCSSKIKVPIIDDTLKHISIF